MRVGESGFICAFCALAGCASPRCVDVRSFHGPLGEVVKVNHLDRYRSWPMMNVPPGEDSGMIYFIDGGDLTLRYHGNPPVVRNAEFWPSDKSPEERYQQTSARWDEWVKAHGGYRPAK